MTHKTKECLERPRKVGAKYTNKDIAADEIIHDASTGLNGQEGFGDYDVKRDRWDGYDPSTHKQVVEEHEALEAARRKLREEAIDKGTAEAESKEVKKLAKKGKGKGKGKKQEADDESDEFGSSDESDNEGGEDEDKYADSADVAGQKLDTKTRVTVRNLRIREDTAKYLMNLDTESAYYDPKTRSMREAPKAGEDVRFSFSLYSLPQRSTSSLTCLALLVGYFRRRQLCSTFRRSDRSAETTDVCVAVGISRTRRPHSVESYCGRAHAQRVPREEGRPQGQECRFDLGEVRRRAVLAECAKGVEEWADGALCRVRQEGQGHQRNGACESKVKVRRRWSVPAYFSPSHHIPSADHIS